MARVLLGVTGGIAAYKAAELARLLVKAGHEVTPILTDEAETFVTGRTFEALVRREAPRELYPHLVQADLLVIAPSRRTPSRSWRTGSPTTCSPRQRSRSQGRFSRRRR